MVEREPLSPAGVDAASGNLSGVSNLFGASSHPSESVSDVARDNIVSPFAPAAVAASRPIPEGVRFPGRLTCGITGEPPAQAVHFGIPYDNGNMPQLSSIG